MNQNNLDPLEQPGQWLAGIYQKEYPVFKHYIVRIINNEDEADDVLGQSFAKLVQEVHKEPGSFPDLANVKKLLYTIIKRDCYSWLRKKRPGSIVTPIDDMADEDTLVRQFEMRDRLLLIHSIINQLSGQLLQVAHLTWVEGCSREEIAQRMNLDVETVSVYKTRALNQLRPMILAQKHNLPAGEYLLLLYWLHAFA